MKSFAEFKLMKEEFPQAADVDDMSGFQNVGGEGWKEAAVKK